MLDDGNLPPPPYRLVDNDQTWLTEADIVFIDPVGTGFSRPEKPELGKKFFGLKGDIESVGEFIRLYLTRNERWSSPLFLAGESYGTTRAAGLAGHLIEKGIAFNGIMLVSTVLNFQTLDFAIGKRPDDPTDFPVGRRILAELGSGKPRSRARGWRSRGRGGGAVTREPAGGGEVGR